VTPTPDPPVRTAPPALLIVTRNFPPAIGGIERVVAEAAWALTLDFRVVVIGPVGGERGRDSGIEYWPVAPSPVIRFFRRTRQLAVRIAREIRPCAVLAGSGVMAPAARAAARASGCPAWALVHGLDVTARHPLYRIFFTPSIKRLDGVLANSRATAGAACRLGVPEARISQIALGVDRPGWPPPRDCRERIRRKWGIPGEARLLLFVGRLTVRKGIGPFIEEVLAPLVASDPGIHLAVVGAAPVQALGRVGVRPEDLVHRAERAGVGAHLHLVGPLTGVRLDEAYFSSDLFVFPVLERPGDMEGFGLVALEAAAHGLATVAFATGGIPDAVSDPESGDLVPPGDYAAMGQAIRRRLAEDPVEAGHAAWRFAGERSWARFSYELKAWVLAHRPSAS
jgi:phosphatidylinositol alpha-1,6-mannosyltransferase